MCVEMSVLRCSAEVDNEKMDVGDATSIWPVFVCLQGLSFHKMRIVQYGLDVTFVGDVNGAADRMSPIIGKLADVLGFSVLIKVVCVTMGGQKKRSPPRDLALLYCEAPKLSYISPGHLAEGQRG